MESHEILKALKNRNPENEVIVFPLFLIGCSTILSLVSSGLSRLSDKFSGAGR